MSEIRQFEDLTNYCHQISPFVLDGVKNVGWIDILARFPSGGVPATSLQKLRSIVEGIEGFQPFVEPIREAPTCPLCGALDMRDARNKSLPNAELWIPAAQTIYAAPITILHYIEVHHYRPPQEYIEAIDALDTAIAFVADEIYRVKLKESGWFNRLA